ncbi:hypothetical protein HMPREF1624_01442 [Sporothrix schenckii ATCC 58251]|uniref:Thioesterase domain-containing protein n=1 Tax=Sporothrix schenckii (strain ATCC 58251 / de Perez 2211183) TaxID=1391915 RepID=U7Q7F2_SPOS1|nr:hypothetical protein HMPREF1624_01442 [Sporothrix schenckii ATCC 58251]
MAGSRKYEIAAARDKAMVAAQGIFDYQGFERQVMRTGKVVDTSLSPPSSIYRAIDYDYIQYSNMNGNFLGDVSRTINSSYLKPFPLNTTVLVHAQVYHIGRTLAMIKGCMTSEDGKTVYATCDHHEVAMATPAHQLAHRVKWDEQWEDEKEIQ